MAYVLMKHYQNASLIIFGCNDGDLCLLAAQGHEHGHELVWQKVENVLQAYGRDHRYTISWREHPVTLDDVMPTTKRLKKINRINLTHE